jgi:cytochrome c-type biogenesis protein
MGEIGITFGVALAGLVSFLSPCVLPLVPPYLAYLGGSSIDDLNTRGRIDDGVRRRTVLGALCFVAGFTTIFVLLGAGASAFGQLIQAYKRELGMVAGAVIVVFGLHFLGLLRINAFYRDARFRFDTEGLSFVGAYILGLAFAFGWTPCIGPILATVLSLAAQEKSLSSGVWLLFVYSLGLGVPFVFAAMAIRPFLSFMSRFRRHLGHMEKIMGVLLVLTGLLFLTGSINWFGQWLLENVPVLARFEEWATPKDLGAEILKKGQR